MAKRTRSTIPGNLTLVDEHNVADEKPAQPAKKPATSKRARKGATSGKGYATPKDDKSDAHNAPVAATNGKAKATKKKPAEKSTTAKGLTMIDLRQQYLDHLARVGKSAGTTFSYGIDMMMAVGYLGEDTPIAGLTVDQIREFYESPAVTKTRSGSPKSQLTIDKTRRVLRQALTWAAQEGFIATAPIPMDAVPPRRRKDITEQQPTESEARS